MMHTDVGRGSDGGASVAGASWLLPGVAMMTIAD